MRMLLPMSPSSSSSGTDALSLLSGAAGEAGHREHPQLTRVPLPAPPGTAMMDFVGPGESVSRRILDAMSGRSRADKSGGVTGRRGTKSDKASETANEASGNPRRKAAATELALEKPSQVRRKGVVEGR